MAASKLEKAQAKIIKLQEENTDLRGSILNMRMLVEATQGEKQGMESALNSAQAIAVGATLQARGKTLRLKADTFKKLGEYAGYNTNLADNGDLLVTLVTKAEDDEQQDS